MGVPASCASDSCGTRTRSTRCGLEFDPFPSSSSRVDGKASVPVGCKARCLAGRKERCCRDGGRDVESFMTRTKQRGTRDGWDGHLHVLIRVPVSSTLAASIVGRWNSR